MKKTTQNQSNKANDMDDDTLIDMKFLVQKSGFTDRYFYKLIQRNEFPAPIKFARASRWLYKDYRNWLDKHIKTSR
ncbi:hypothetical protein KJB16_002342 [Salmonella enterica]|nr:hypothetical protein [Salmonella enterica]EHN5666323.1 hypothetical protein [Salmonella enterica]